MLNIKQIFKMYCNKVIIRYFIESITIICIFNEIILVIKKAAKSIKEVRETHNSFNSVESTLVMPCWGSPRRAAGTSFNC